jgi:lipoprotein-anchoring transpeptidase ErfK/SrfK
LSLFTLFLLACLLVLNACSHSDSTQVKANSQPAISAAQLQEGQAQLRTFQQWIALLQQFKGKTSAYQQNYTSDQRALKAATNGFTYQGALNTLAEHINSIKIPALKAESGDLQQKLSEQATAWSKAHTYYDRYNNITYHLGYEYGPDGMGGVISDELSSAQTLADYQQAIEDANTSLASFQAYKNNLSDATSWNKVHQSDLTLIQNHGFTNEKVVVVSLGEQAMRIYNGAQLVRAFRVTTGRPERPSLPGFWEVENKLSPTTFKSDAPVGSAYWYPDTPIHYALLYHSGGYFIHDSWWRDDYGPDTQFPHADSSGDTFSFDGSHGCINVSLSNAAWIYWYVGMYTRVLVY